MFELKIEDAKYWRDCVESIVNLVGEGTFNIAKDGIRLKAMDPSITSMVSFFIPQKAFSKYNVEKDVSIGLNIDNLNKIMSRTRDNESLVMKDSENKLNLEFIGQSAKRRYKLQIIDIGKKEDREPNRDFEAHVEISGDAVKDIIKDASMISSYVSFRASKEQFTISAKGDSGELEVLHEKDADVMKKMDIKSKAAASFNLEFLDSMIKSCPMGSNVGIDIKSDELMKLRYNIGEAEVVYFLAAYMME